MKKTIYRLSVVAAALAAVLLTAQCAKEIDPAAESKSQDSIGDGIEVTLTATKGEDTRTELTASGAEMTVTWSTGDKIYVVGETDGLRGSLTLSSGANTKTATFKGCISYLTAQQNVRFYYLGKSDATISEDTFTLDISSQDGTLDGIESTMHLMCGTLSNVSPSTVSFGTVTMTNMIAIGKFDIVNCTGYNYEKAATLSGACSSAKVDLKTGTWENQTPGTITLGAYLTDSYYIALIPGEYTLSFSQTDKKASQPYTASRITTGNRYYTADASGNSIEVGIYPYIEKGVFRGYGRIISDDLVWAPVNCGYDDDHTYGLLYQWGRNNGQGYLDNTYSPREENPTISSSYWSGNNGAEDSNTFYIGSESSKSNWLNSDETNYWNTGTESTPIKNTEFDPCPDGWRVPSKTELATLTSSSFSRTWTTVSSQNGVLLKTGPRTFFMPLLGYRKHDTGAASLRGTNGHLWCSASETGAGSSRNGYLLTYNNNDNQNYMAIDNQPRANGFAVRCVRLPDSVGTSLPGMSNEDVETW